MLTKSLDIDSAFPINKDLFLVFKKKTKKNKNVFIQECVIHVKKKIFFFFLQKHKPFLETKKKTRGRVAFLPSLIINLAKKIFKNLS